MYVRKTEDVWVVEGWYNNQWEGVCCAVNKKEARDLLKTYDENERNYAHRIRKIRVKKENC